MNLISPEILPATPEILPRDLGDFRTGFRYAVATEGMQAFTLLPEQAADVTLVWAWEGEPHATLGVGGWRFGVQIL